MALDGVHSHGKSPSPHVVARSSARSHSENRDLSAHRKLFNPSKSRRSAHNYVARVFAAATVLGSDAAEIPPASRNGLVCLFGVIWSHFPRREFEREAHAVLVKGRKLEYSTATGVLLRLITNQTSQRVWRSMS